jgi:hypothetical protein
VAEGRKSRDFIPDYRKEKWLGNAMELVHAHPLDEVVAVIDWLFTTCRGELPHLVVAERPDLMRPGDLKLTRLVQIQENYDGLVREMGRCGPADPDGAVDRIQGSKVNYGAPFGDHAE